MPKSVVLDSILPQLDIYQRFAPAREAGFTHVDIDDWTELDFNQVKANLVENSLRISCLGGDKHHTLAEPGNVEEFLEFLSQSLAVSKSLACPNLRIQAGVGKAGATAALLDGVAKADKAGRTLLLEPAANSADPAAEARANDQISALVKAVGSIHCRMLLRLRLRSMNLDTIQVLAKKYRGTVGYIQIEDFPDMGRIDNPQTFYAGLNQLLENELGYYIGFIAYKLDAGKSAHISLSALANAKA
ncbi:MAG: hypothetical protein LIP23_03595 [Planctomycetes bacterium]|nr:hypothetical protein [Planctomycetota bacterium]